MSLAAGSTRHLSDGRRRLPTSLRTHLWAPLLTSGPSYTLSVQLNGHPLSPLEVTSATADISQWLIEGENTVLAEVATPLGNVMRPIWHQLMTSGTGPSDFVDRVPAPVASNYGLIKDVTVQPYWNILVS